LRAADLDGEGPDWSKARTGPASPPGEDELIKRACGHDNARRAGQEWEGTSASDDRATPDPDDELLGRIAVNYLRRRMTGYDAEGGKIKSKVGVDDACEVILEKVFGTIAKVYPWLELECQRRYFERLKQVDSRRLEKLRRKPC
jgi:hypothetical protein